MLWCARGDCRTVCRTMATQRNRLHLRLSPNRSAALGRNIKQARIASGLTQEALALATGLTAQHLQRLERGLANPTLATVYAIADALSRPVHALLSE
jgi:DNA-binding XRE family transcriptional regulator